MKALRATIHGRVQGVGYRWSCATEAERLGVAGWVRNLPSGQVEAWLEGDDAAVDELLDWCREGPRFGEVTRVDVSPVAPKGLTRFQVR